MVTMLRIFKIFRLPILTFFFLLPLNIAFAQGLLGKHINVDIKSQKISNVLTQISKQGGFQFSYSGKNFPKDSLVTFTANNQPIYTVLTQLFNDKYEYEERRNYIIITPALQRLSFINTDVTSDNNNYSISGIVVNEKTGERLMNTSVYEKEQLVSTLTDEHGYFKLKLRSDALDQTRITASKYAYRDTSLSFLNTVVISNRTRARIFQHDGKDVEETALGRIFMTAAQRIQSINIQDFFANRPYQVSLTPGLSSHGSLSSQVINKFSLNLAGGYTAGVDGVELGGLFNINKRDTRYVQFAGVFNLVGGTVTGLQLAGVSNQALDTVKGAQIAGFSNTAEGQVSGLQLSTLNNRAHKLKGVQIGLVNQADTSEGVSIGLINIIRNGLYKVSISSNNLMNTNVSISTGTHRFYTKFNVGVNIWPDRLMYGFGMGAGHDFMFSDKIYLSAEGGYMFMNTGVWADRWMYGKLLLNAQLSKRLSVFAGPSYNRYANAERYQGEETRYKEIISYPNNHFKKFGGWEAGIALTSAFKPALKADPIAAEGWSLGLRVEAGLGLEYNKRRLGGIHFFTERELGRRLQATLSAGYVVATSTQTIYSPGNYFTESIVKAVPLKAGVKSYLTKSVFFAGEVGFAFTLNQNTGTYTFLESSYTYYDRRKSFLFSLSAGHKISDGLEASLKYDNYLKFYGVSNMSVGLSYRLKL